MKKNLKIKKNYFNIFSNKKTFKNNYNYTLKHAPKTTILVLQRAPHCKKIF
jgi:hypothetical protein